MDDQVYSILEFDKVREMLARRASFVLGKELAQQLEPSVVAGQVERWLDETSQARRVIELGVRPPLTGLQDIRRLVRRASIGSILHPEELLEIATTVQSVARLRTYFLRPEAQELAPTLADLAQSMGLFPKLDKEISRCIDREGRVTDHASAELAGLRARLRTYRRRVREYLERLTKGTSGRRYLQEPIVTLRNGRYVVPVKQEYRTEIPGIVHDQSTSGATLFVEPMPVVDLNNTIRQTEREEEQEVERILAELSDLVAQDADQLITSVEMAGELDFICAKALLSIDWEAVHPRLNEQGTLTIKKGRHPLLTGMVVPIDVWLGHDFTALIITGPNTGGKTVTLKTVGLFCLMAQSGLHVPAEPETELCIFRSVFADIGDEQSIEQNLSTFSSHLRNIVNILRQVDDRSLVLLDELGAGTDPTEGAALAIAILEKLCDEIGCRTIATTHYNELKTFAYSHPCCENASVEFDVQTLQPTYRLAIGVAGRSHALAIADRLGLQRDIIEKARNRLAGDVREVDVLLDSVEEDRRIAATEREEAEALRRQYEELYDKYKDAYERLKAGRDAIIEETRRESIALLQNARRQADELLGTLRKAGQASQSVLEKTAKDVRAQLAGALDKIQTGSREAGQKEIESTSERSLTTLPAVGDRVLVTSLQQSGDVVQVMPDGTIGVQVGSLRINVPLSDLEKSKDRPVTKLQRSGIGELARRKAMQVQREIDLRGMMVEEALEQVDKYIDDAILAGVHGVRIIHGKGTGALRRAIQDFLAEDSRVSDFRLGDPSEGGSGVTEVTLG